MLKRSRILIVDDHPTNIAILEEMLEADYLLETATSGADALAIAPAFYPDMILLDVMMPGLDGYETCRRLRTCPGLQHAKIIMVSAKTLVDERLQGYAAGADDYVTKPFEQEELLAKVRVYLRLKSVEEVDQLKSELLQWLSHETRTPLNGIIAPVQLLMDDPGLAVEAQQHYLAMVQQSAGRLHRLVEKVVTLSDLKTGKHPFALTIAGLSDVVRAAIAAVTDFATEKGVRLGQRLCERDAVQLDLVHMERVVITLLQYAIRLSPIDSEVFVGLSEQDTQVALTITDQGEGIDPALLPHIFDEFAPVDGVLLTEGQGLSLAIAQQIVLAHGGLIRLQSIRGVGTTFTVILPAIALPAVVTA